MKTFKQFNESAFSKAQLQQLEKMYGGLEKMTTDQGAKLRALLEPLPDSALKQLSKSKAKFVRSISSNILMRKELDSKK